MAREEKPYRVYRGGRVKGKVPTVRARARAQPRDEAQAAAARARTTAGPGTVGAEARALGAAHRRSALGALVLLADRLGGRGLVLVLERRLGREQAPRRRTRSSALAHQSGLLISHSTTILLLGTDNAQLAARAGDMHSDSIMLLRTDPSHHRLYYLSIPRDLRGADPRRTATQKINAAFQIGGAALAIKTIRDFTGLDVNHVIVVNFGDFKDLIDALGGIDVNVPKPIRSNRFDCPYATQARCDAVAGLALRRRATQHMNGERALIYSRIRENLLDPSETDFTRGARQQAVIDAVTSKLTSFGTFLAAAVQGRLVRQAARRPTCRRRSSSQLGWVKFRASGVELGPLPARRRLRRRRHGRTERGQPRDARDVPRQVGAAAADRQFDPGCVIGHPLQ